MLGLNHYLWMQHFMDKYHTVEYVMGFFLVCVWMVPFGFFISLAANESVLPMSMANSGVRHKPLPYWKGLARVLGGATVCVIWILDMQISGSSAGVLAVNREQFVSCGFFRHERRKTFWNCFLCVCIQFLVWNQ